jgi:hypothetical protein
LGGVAVDDTGVYWVNGGTLMRLSRGATTPTVPTSGSWTGGTIVLDASSIYWAALVSHSPAIRKLAK